MKKLCLLVALGLAGCDLSSRVQPFEMDAAEQLCAQNGGVNEIYIGNFASNRFVRCKDGEIHGPWRHSVPLDPALQQHNPTD